jgi:hypothetical protein
VSQWVASGWLVDLIIGFTVLEIVGLWLFHRLTGRGLDAPRLLPNLMAGLSLMLAVRAAMAQAAWPWIVIPMAASGLFHVADLRQRWPRKPRTLSR